MANPEFIAFTTTSGRHAQIPAAQAATFERAGWTRAEESSEKEAPQRGRRAKAKKDADAPAEDASEN